MGVDARKYADRRDYLIAAVHKRRKIVRLKAVVYKGGRCQRCGYDRCPEALEFHHTEGSTKEFGVSSGGYTRSWEKVKSEVDKYTLLCANCHREVHAGIAAFPGNRD
jgi:hypothetical protein